MKTRLLSVAVTVMLGCALSASAQTRSSDSSAGRRSSAKTKRVKRAQHNSARDLLRKNVGGDGIDWDERPLEEVVGWIRGMSNDNVNVIPRWNALEAEGIDIDSPVTLKLRGITVGEVLDETMSQLSEEGLVTFHATKNKLTISTKADFDRKMFTRTYQVGDILFEVVDMAQSFPAVDLQQASRSSGGGGGGGQSIFGGSGGGGSSQELQMEESEMEERITRIRTLIEEIVEPDSWDSSPSGAGLGRIRVHDNRLLVVRATVEIHEKLAGHFTLLQ